jgi:putative cardiolipin synthase
MGNTFKPVPCAPEEQLVQARYIAASILASSVLGGCASLEPRPELPVESAVSLAGDTPFDRLIEPAEARHPGMSGFRLSREGPESLVIRLHPALLASRSIDVQTYIWHQDMTGALIATRLLESADRGVKVRLLVDDLDARGKNFAFAALDTHPNIQVRLFNPFRSRAGTLSFVRCKPAYEGNGGRRARRVCRQLQT